MRQISDVTTVTAECAGVGAYRKRQRVVKQTGWRRLWRSGEEITIPGWQEGDTR